MLSCYLNTCVSTPTGYPQLDSVRVSGYSSDRHTVVCGTMCAVCTVSFTVYSLQCTLYNVNCTVFTVGCWHLVAHHKDSKDTGWSWSLKTLQSTLLLYSLQCILYTVSSLDLKKSIDAKYCKNMLSIQCMHCMENHENIWKVFKSVQKQFSMYGKLWRWCITMQNYAELGRSMKNVAK